MDYCKVIFVIFDVNPVQSGWLLLIGINYLHNIYHRNLTIEDFMASQSIHSKDILIMKTNCLIILILKHNRSP